MPCCYPTWAAPPSRPARRWPGWRPRTSWPPPGGVRVNAPWPVEGHGTPVVTTATLAGRAQPYDLAVELARGRLNDVRNQAADWSLMGLLIPSALEARLGDARRAFSRAVT